MALTVRRYAADKDHDAIIQLMIQLFDYLADQAGKEHWMTENQAEQSLKEWLDDNLLFSCIDDDKIVGLVRLREDHGVYWVEDLVVSSDRRRQGLGSAILRWVEEWVQEQGAKALFLDIVPSNLSSLDFYLENGYEYLNTVELRKNFYDTEPKKEVAFLGRRLKIHSWPEEKPLP